ncbi:MAG: hypothetical protein RSA22_08440 [Acinetobacter sp.]|jgi:hypothetical protein
MMDHNKKYKHLKCIAAMVLLHLILLMLFPFYQVVFLHADPPIVIVAVAMFFVICTAGLGIFIILVGVIFYLLFKHTILYLLFLLTVYLLLYRLAQLVSHRFDQLFKLLLYVLSGLTIFYLCAYIYVVFIKTNVAAFPKIF